MDQITGNPRSLEGTSGWKFAHQRLSQMLIERVEPFNPLAPIMKLDDAGIMYQRLSVPSAYLRAGRGRESINPLIGLEAVLGTYGFE